MPYRYRTTPARLAFAAVVAGFLAVSPVAHAAPILVSYDIQTNPGTPAITNIAIYQTYIDCCAVVNWATTLPASPGGTIDDFFPNPSDDRPLTALILGLLDRNNATQELVMMMDDAAASTYVGQPWPASWPDEIAVQNALFAFTNFSPNQLAPGEWDAAFALVDDFVDNTPDLPWFDLHHGATFSVVEWSTGTLIGTGTVRISAVPEPTSMLLVASGLVGIFVRRRL